MKSPALILAAIIMTTTGAFWAQSRAADQPAQWEEGKKLDELSKASQALYKKVSASLVRVKIENGFAGNAPAPLLKEFEEWRQKQGAGGPGRRDRPDRPERHPKEADPAPAATTMPARNSGIAGAAGFRKFLEQKLKESPDADSQARIHAILARMENGGGRAQAGAAGQATPAAEVMGVVIDDQGNTLVAWGGGGIIARENAAATFRVTTSDGTELAAKYVGAHTGRGVAIIKLDSPGIATPLAMAEGRPAGGEMLMCLNARQGSVGWIAAPGNTTAHHQPTSRRATDERFPVFGSDERGATYLFNTSGELAAVGSERYALPIDVIKSDIQWIVKNGKDITPRHLGVKYDPVPPDMRKSLPALSDKPAVLVKEVAPGSPAEKAGLKKGDILLTIDEVSVALLPQIQVDLATRKGAVTVEVIRAGQEKTLEMPLTEK